MGLIPAKPATMAANDTGVGNIEDDTFYYFVTFTYDNGQESGMLTLAAGYGAVATTTGAGSKITVTNVPTGNARVTARNLYRCSGTNPSQIFYVGTINDNVSTTYVDNVASAKLGLPVPASTIYNYPKPYKSRIQFVHEERLIQMNLQEDLYLPIPTADVTLTSSNSGTGTLTPGQVWSFKIYKLWFTTFNPITNEEVQYIISQPLTKSVTILGGHDSITFAHSSSDLWYGSIHLQAADVNTTVNYHPFDDTVTGYNSSIRAAGTTFGIQQITPKGGIGVTPEGEGTKYTSWVAFSEESEPDKITRGNLMKIGQDDNEEITAGFSRYGGWDVFKGSSIHRVFTPSRDPITWEQKKIVEDIGSTYPESIVQLPDDSYIFAMNKRTAGADRVTFYYWDGHSSPKIISGSIQSYLNGITVSDIDAVHDKANNFVRIAYTIEGSYKGQELVYDPNKVGPNGNVYQDWANGIWNPNPRNTADLELRCPFVTKAGKLLYGHEQGYVYHQSTTSNQDKLGAGHSNTQILVKCQPKTQEDLQGELKIKKLLFNVVASGAGSANGFVIYTSADDSESPLANPPTVASGENRFEVGVNIRAKKFYLRVEHAENINIKLRMVGWDFDVRHRGSGARR
jgi:hypothetical protein